MVEPEFYLNQIKEFGLKFGFDVDNVEADIVWKIRDEPLFTFFLDEKGGNRAFNESARLLWLSSDYYAVLPWRHYILILTGGMFDENLRVLRTIEDQFSIEVIEDLSESWEIFEGSILKDIKNMLKILKRYLNSSNDIREGVKNLSTVASTWRKSEETFRSRFSEKGVINWEVLRQVFYGLHVDRKTVPMEITVESISLEGVLLRIVNSDEDIILSSEHRNLPWIFDLKLRKHKPIDLKIKFEVDKASILQVMKYEMLTQSLKQEKSFSLSLYEKILVEFTPKKQYKRN